MSANAMVTLQFLLGFGVPIAFAVREILSLKPVKEPPFNGGEPTIIDLASRRPAAVAPTVTHADTEVELRRAA